MLELSREEKLMHAKQKLHNFRKQLQDNKETSTIPAVSLATNIESFDAAVLPMIPNYVDTNGGIQSTQQLQTMQMVYPNASTYQPTEYSSFQETTPYMLTQQSPVNMNQLNGTPVYQPQPEYYSPQKMIVPDYQSQILAQQPFTPYEYNSIMPTAATEAVSQLSQQLNNLSNMVPLSPQSDIVSDLSVYPPTTGFNGTPPQNQIQENRTLRASPQSLPPLHQQQPVFATYPYRQPSSLDCRSTSRSSMQPGYSTSPSANSILIRELQQRNVELATLLEQRNETHDRSLAQVASLREQLQRLKYSSEEDRSSLEASTQREIARARDQVRAHAQTVGALVAEKTELQAKLAHLERVSEQTNREIEEMSMQQRESRQKMQALEDKARLASSNSEHLESSKLQTSRQLEMWRAEAKREKEEHNALQAEFRETTARLSERDHEVEKLALQVEDLQRQLEVALAFSKTRGIEIPKPGTPIASLQSSSMASPTTSTLTCSRCDSLKARIQELETSGVHSVADKGRLESQYKAYVADMEKQNNDLRIEVESAAELKAKLQKSVEDLRRQLTMKESQLTDFVNELEQLKTCRQIQEAENSCNHQVLPPELKPISEQEIVNSDVYRKLESTVSTLTEKLCEATTRLVQLEEEAADATSRLADKEAVLATANSERAGLSRAMEQNRKIKEQLAVMQNALEHVTADSAEVHKEVEELRLLSASQAAALKATEESLVSADNKCAVYEAEVELLKQATLATSTTPCVADTPSFNDHLKSARDALAASENKCIELEKNVNELKENAVSKYHQHELDSLRLLSSNQTAALNSAQQTLTLVEEKYAELLHDSSIAVKNQQNSELEKVENEEILNLRNQLTESQLECKQLEGRLVELISRLSVNDEEKSHAEALVAQLEMESSSIGEYITLFAHRRQLAGKRARIREALLARLVRDRRQLRSRLTGLLHIADEILSSSNTDKTEGVTNQTHVHRATLVTFKGELTDFLNELEISVSTEESVDYPEGDERTDDDDDWQMAAADENHHHDISYKRDPIGFDDQLRLLATVHDCPHCDCCSGSLLVV